MPSPQNSEPVLNNPLTIDTQNHTLYGSFIFDHTGATLIIAGRLVGIQGGAPNLYALTTSSGTLQSNIINNGVIIGGPTGAGGGLQLQTAGFLNNGIVNGGLGTGTNSGGFGVAIRRNSTVTNYGTINGGDSQAVGGGTAVDMGSPGGTSTLINNGTIKGGSALGSTGAGGYGIYARAGSAPIINSGVIQGGDGNGGAAIGGSTAITLINSGTIRAGAGQTAAILAPASAATSLTLELHAGSTIVGNVIASTGAMTDILRLGGNTNATFDVSSIGSAAQYQNFEQFEKTGSSAWTLIGNGTTSTPWNIQQGTLQLGNGGTSGNFIGDVIDSDTLAFNRSDAFTFANTISGKGLVTQVGGGVTTLTATNTYTGGTAILAGTLRISMDANLGGETSVLVLNGGTLETGADITTTRFVAFTGNGTLLTDNGTTLTLNGVVSDRGALVKAGAGTLVLGAANTYSGGTVISDGTLQVGNGGTSGSFVGDVFNNAALVFNRSNVLTINGVLSGSGNVTQAGNGTTILAGDNTYTGTTTISAGTLKVGNGGTSGSIVGDIVNNAMLAFNRSDTMLIGGTISGTGSLTQLGVGTTVLTGNNTYAGGTAISAGVLQVGNGGTSGSVAGDIVDNGGLVFNRSDTIDFVNAITGNGTVTQAGTGSLVFNGAQTYTGATAVDAGRLTINGSITSSVTVSAAGTLVGIGTIFGNVANAGTVAPGGSFDRLTVAGNYIGQGGTLAIDAMLDGDASQASRLVVTGDTSGTTDVKVAGRGGSGAQTTDGIKIVDVQGASNGTFNLLGDYVFQGQQAIVSGAYAYRLYKNGVSTPGDGDWYLRSNLVSPTQTTPPIGPVSPLYAPSVPLYESYLGVLQQLNTLGTLQQRVGNRDTLSDNGCSAWVRIDGGHTDLTPETSTSDSHYDATSQKAQIGVDAVMRDSDGGRLVAGGTMQYGHVTSDVSSIFGNGRIKTTGYGFGGTLTWYGKNGIYVDVQGQLNWYKTDLSSYTLGKLLANGNHGSGYNFGAEAGQTFALSHHWSLIPQGQLIYSSVRFSSFSDPYGAEVLRDSGDSLIARAGLAIDYAGAGENHSSHVYGIANLYYDFLDGNKVDVSSTGLVSKNAPLWGGVGVGGSISWGQGHYTVYGEGLAQTSLKHYGDSQSFGARIGFSMKW